MLEKTPEVKPWPAFILQYCKKPKYWWIVKWHIQQHEDYKYILYIDTLYLHIYISTRTYIHTHAHICACINVWVCIYIHTRFNLYWPQSATFLILSGERLLLELRTKIILSSISPLSFPSYSLWSLNFWHKDRLQGSAIRGLDN